MTVKPAGLTNAEVRTTLGQMAQAIIVQAQAMTGGFDLEAGVY